MINSREAIWADHSCRTRIVSPKPISQPPTTSTPPTAHRHPQIDGEQVRRVGVAQCCQWISAWFPLERSQTPCVEGFTQVALLHHYLMNEVVGALVSLQL